ncbi:MAG TPA: R3H domain-containing nucleic acid-binding protein [Pyrinomonadaceae bacterium]|jgi:spoIIIJ-associated protein|nr:R3H domain-containing nucleic acid-binding protein [Pyrinomonadaceae bacterium]
MNETCTQAQDFLNSILTGMGCDLQASTVEADAGCLLNIDGADTSLLLNEGGELLEALQHLLNQAFGRSLPKGERIVCDVENFRATREAELRAMARHAAERVRSNGVAFTFGPMDANERRVIHLSLAEESDLHTESIGEGAARRLKVSLKARP